MVNKKIIAASIGGLLTLTSLIGSVNLSNTVIVNAASKFELVKEIKEGEVIDIAKYPDGLIPENKSEYHRLWKKDIETEEYKMIPSYVKGDSIKVVGEYRLVLISTGKTISFKVIDSSGKAESVWKEEEKVDISNDDIAVKISSKHSTYHSGKIVENGDIVTKNVYVEWSNKDIDSVTIQRNNEVEKPYKQGTLIIDDGKYIIKAKYKSSKTTSTSFEIDKTPPIVTSSTHDLGLVNYYNRIKDYEKHSALLNQYDVSTTKGISVEGVSKDIKGASLKKSDEVNSKPYEFGTLITEEGNYSLAVYDYAGNAALVNINIVKNVPTVEEIKDGDVIDLKDSPKGVNLKSTGYRTWDFCIRDNEEYSPKVITYERKYPEYRVYSFSEVGKYEYRVYNTAGEKRIKFEVIDSSK